MRQLRQQAREVGKEIRRKEKALAATAALLVLKKKPRHFGGTARSPDTPEQPQLAIPLIQDAVAAGARQHKACDVLGISARTCRRWQDQQRCLETLTDQRQSVLRAWQIVSQ